MKKERKMSPFLVQEMRGLYLDDLRERKRQTLKFTKQMHLKINAYQTPALQIICSNQLILQKLIILASSNTRSNLYKFLIRCAAIFLKRSKSDIFVENAETVYCILQSRPACNLC